MSNVINQRRAIPLRSLERQQDLSYSQSWTDDNEDGSSSQSEFRGGGKKRPQEVEGQSENEQIRINQEIEMHQAGNNMRLNINMQVVFVVVVGMIGYWGPWMAYSSLVS